MSRGCILQQVQIASVNGALESAKAQPSPWTPVGEWLLLFLPAQNACPAKSGRPGWLPHPPPCLPISSFQGSGHASRCILAASQWQSSAPECVCAAGVRCMLFVLFGS